MEQQQIEEGNAIIAKFIGGNVRSSWKTANKNYLIWYGKEAMEWREKMMRIKNVESILVEQLLFHSDWNWLMPVVEKIEAIQDEHHGHFGVYISSNGCTIQATNFRSDKPLTNPPHYFADYTLETKLIATWYACVEFIKWHNSQPA